VTVVTPAEAVREPLGRSGLQVRRLLGERTGFAAFEQAIIDCPPGESQTLETGDAEQTLYVLEGHGELLIAGGAEALDAETAVYLAPGSACALRNPGPGALSLIAVRVNDPVAAEPRGAGGEGGEGGEGGGAVHAVCRLADQDLADATADREFRILADPGTGLRSATHFVGYIPPGRAPDHFHLYDEVILVLDGEGVMHAGQRSWPLAPGCAIQLPARNVHCLENTGSEPMRVIAVFRPAGSPAEAYYPDGAPAYYAGAAGPSQGLAGSGDPHPHQPPEED
jgi:quercetin dioxygenase-like cupin family protein